MIPERILISRSTFLALSKVVSREFPKSPEGNLFSAVVCTAISDYNTWYPSKEVIDYLSGDIYHAEAAGVSSGWIRGLMARAGLPLPID